MTAEISAGQSSLSMPLAWAMPPQTIVRQPAFDARSTIRRIAAESFAINSSEYCRSADTGLSAVISTSLPDMAGPCIDRHALVSDGRLAGLEVRYGLVV